MRSVMLRKEFSAKHGQKKYQVIILLETFYTADDDLLTELNVRDLSSLLVGDMILAGFINSSKLKVSL